jgi:hypothetical protein
VAFYGIRRRPLVSRLSLNQVRRPPSSPIWVTLIRQTGVDLPPSSGARWKTKTTRDVFKLMPLRQAVRELE